MASLHLSMYLLLRSVHAGGGYVNFGVFSLYGDKALENALETVLKLVTNVSA